MRRSYSATNHPKTALNAALLALAIFAASIVGLAEPTSPAIAAMFPPELGGFRQVGSVQPLSTLLKEGILKADYFPGPDGKEPAAFQGGEAQYTSAQANLLRVEIVKLENDSSAYSLFSLATRKTQEAQIAIPADIGIASFADPGSIMFVRGSSFVRVTIQEIQTVTRPLPNESATNAAPAIALAQLIAANIDKGEDDFPVLLKHLPDWQTARKGALYAVAPGPLQEAIQNQPVLNEVSFEGGTEAVLANYGPSQLLICEFTTPQLAGESDRRIVPKLQELKGQGQPAPTVYRKVGNYSVFVFNAPDEATANQLVDQVKYEQVVQWLGEDPHLFNKLQRLYANMSANVLVTVLKTSGISMLLCLGIGGLLGALLFRRRRALQRQTAVYSDAGGMVRLNLDEMTGSSDPRRLLEAGNPPKSDSSTS